MLYSRIIVIFAFLVLTITTSLSLHCPSKAPCIGIRDCAPIMSLVKIMRKPLKSSVVAFLKSQQCGFSDGAPKVCCMVIPKGLKIFESLKPPVEALPRYWIKNKRIFDITVATAPPHATAVPYIASIINKNGFQEMGSKLKYDLVRRKRSSENQSTDIEIRR